MTVKIGVFKREEAVLDAIRMLRESGAEQEELRIVVNNRETAPLLSSNADVPVEEIQGILETREHFDVMDDVVIPVAPAMTGYPLGVNTGMVGAGTVGAVPVFDADGRRPDTGRILQEIGIPDGAAEACSDAVEAGHFLLVTEIGDHSELDAELLLHNAGAARVLH